MGSSPIYGASFVVVVSRFTDKHLVEITTTFADVAQRKSIRLISERPTFRNCPSVPVLESIQQIKNFTVNEKKRILLYFWSLFPSADCKSVAFNWRVVGGWFDSFRLHQLPTYIMYVIIKFAGRVVTTPVS